MQIRVFVCATITEHSLRLVAEPELKLKMELELELEAVASF